MATKIFVNLPVKDLNASIAFFTQIGFSFNQQFSDTNGTCMIVGDDIYVMLLTEPFFQTFITKPIADARQCTEAILCLQLDSRATVDEMADRALAAGGQPVKAGGPEVEFMYGRNFQDLDGHLWELMYMDPAFVPQTEPATEVSAS
ncbi:VOC family protein [Hymenobacter sp. CRA2]|uniref:VOC family protein n=1 Tax=Hymenobacter sp. CRA2 TaxID=1955620 RepID=UPI00098FB3E7|nr:VOC family protein [Hymenobacter sp. CRA2]OON67856.1 hypothetical protein B0919_16895 [Hymenobacter sp. CRA2]